MTLCRSTLLALAGAVALMFGGLVFTQGATAEEATGWRWFDAWTQREDGCYGPGTSGPNCKCYEMPPIEVEV